MNYFAHGLRFLNAPYVLAGAAVPDWLNFVDRKVRVRSKRALPWVTADDPVLAAVAQGVVQHHHDDDWFHRGSAFNELQWKFTGEFRKVLSGTDHRPSFLGHIVVELLLDSVLSARLPGRLEAYYQALAQLDVERVQQAVETMTEKSVPMLGRGITLFCRERFLFDYDRDDKLWARLNHVMFRVGLPPLPAEFIDVLAPARAAVDERVEELAPGLIGT